MFVGLTFPPGYTPQITLTGRTSGAVFGPFAGVALPGKPTEYVFDVGELADGDYDGTIASPFGAFCLRLAAGHARTEADWDDFDDGGGAAPPEPPVAPKVDPADRPLSKSVDGQSVTHHSLRDRIEWERHQATKAAGGGWGAVGFGQVRLGGPAEDGPIRGR